jgi:cytochrome c6
VLVRGARLFEANCAGCHRGGMNFIKEQKTLKKEAMDKFLSTTDQDKVLSFLTDKMPHSMLPFKKTFSEQDYFDTTSYVLDQALGDKW